MKFGSFHSVCRLVTLVCVIVANQPLGVLAQTSAPVPAQLSPAAQEAIDKGLIAAKEQEWEIAIQSFQEAHKAAPDSPVPLYNLGLAESKIQGRELRAISWFGAYLAAKPNAQNAAAVREAVSGLQIKSEANINRLIKFVQDADDQIPDTPITHDNGITGFTNKPDIDRIMDLYKVADLWASAGNSTNAVELAHRIGAAGYNESHSLGEIVAAQTVSGHLADAIKIAASEPLDSVERQDAQLNIAAAQAKSGDSVRARDTLRGAQSMAAGDESVYLRNSWLGKIAGAQAEIGDFSGAQRTAGLIPSPEPMSQAEIAIAIEQDKAGDSAGARASLLLAQQDIDRWTSLPDAQKRVACACALDPESDSKELASMEQTIAEVRKTAEASTVVSAKGSPPPSGAVSVAEWAAEVDQLNAPMFLDLSAALKTPQATAKIIYPGSASEFDDSNGDPKKIFDALVAIANQEISAKNTIDQMLKKQAREGATL